MKPNFFNSSLLQPLLSYPKKAYDKIKESTNREKQSKRVDELSQPALKKPHSPPVSNSIREATKKQFSNLKVFSSKAFYKITPLKKNYQSIVIKGIAVGVLIGVGSYFKSYPFSKESEKKSLDPIKVKDQPPEETPFIPLPPPPISNSGTNFIVPITLLIIGPSFLFFVYRFFKAQSSTLQINTKAPDLIVKTEVKTEVKSEVKSEDSVKENAGEENASFNQKKIEKKQVTQKLLEENKTSGDSFSTHEVEENAGQGFPLPPEENEGQPPISQENNKTIKRSRRTATKIWKEIKSLFEKEKQLQVEEEKKQPQVEGKKIEKVLERASQVLVSALMPKKKENTADSQTKLLSYLVGKGLSQKLLHRNFDPKNYEKKRAAYLSLLNNIFKKAGEEKDLWKLGLCYEEGVGVEKDSDTAYKCYSCLESDEAKFRSMMCLIFPSGETGKVNLTQLVSIVKKMSSAISNITEASFENSLLRINLLKIQLIFCRDKLIRAEGEGERNTLKGEIAACYDSIRKLSRELSLKTIEAEAREALCFFKPPLKIMECIQEFGEIIGLYLNSARSEPHALYKWAHYIEEGCYLVLVENQEDIDLVSFYKEAAHLGNPHALLKLAECYQKGSLGVSLDQNRAELLYKEAFFLYQRAANLGNTSAMNNLALFYLFGLGIEKNEEEALKLLKKAVNYRDADAMFNLAMFFEKKEPENEDISALYLFASYLGHPEAMTKCAERLAKSSPERKMQFYRMAAQLGNTLAINKVAESYREKSPVQSKTYFVWGALLGNKEALDQIKGFTYEHYKEIGIEEEKIEFLRAWVKKEAEKKDAPEKVFGDFCLSTKSCDIDAKYKL